MMDWTLTLSVDVTLNLLFVFLFFSLPLGCYVMMWYGALGALSPLCVCRVRVFGWSTQ